VRPEAGERVVVRTPDRREYRGRLLEIRERDSRPYALVRLDTGWETTYPLHMVHPEREKSSD
jgi:hypothetical protein